MASLAAATALANQEFNVAPDATSSFNFAEEQLEREALDSTEWLLSSSGSKGLVLPLDVAEETSTGALSVEVDFRSTLSKQELSELNSDFVIVEIPETLSCAIKAPSADFVCDVGASTFTISGEKISGYNEWAQMTLSLEAGFGSLTLNSNDYSAASEEAVSADLSLGSSVILGKGLVGELRNLVVKKDSQELSTPKTWLDLVQETLKVEPLAERLSAVNALSTMYANQAIQGAGITTVEALQTNLVILEAIETLFEEANSALELSSVDTISELVDTIVTFQVYDELIDIEVASKITQILNLLETLGNPYELYRRDFENLQKMINLTGRMIAFIDEKSADAMFLNGRNLQGSIVRSSGSSTSSLDSLRNLMKLILKVKNSQGDQKCTQIDTTFWIGEQSHFELQVLKVPIGNEMFVPEQKTFTHTIGDLAFAGQVMDIVAPVRELVNQTLLKNPTAKYFCLQVTFFKVNPKLLVDEESDRFQFIDESRVITSVTSLDSTGYRLLDQHETRMNNFDDIRNIHETGQNAQDIRGVQNLQRPFYLNYPYDFPFGANANNFDERNVACAYYWSHTHSVGEGHWSMDGCQTGFDFRNNMVNCVCSGISHVRYKLMRHIYKDPALSAPTFDLQKVSSPQEYVFSHMANTWSIDIERGNLDNPDVVTEITVSPAEIFDINNLILDKENARFTIIENGLFVDTLYSIEVRIRNSTFNEFNQLFTNETTQRVDFRTERPPFGGIFNVSPEQGYAEKTYVKVTITNWESKHYPLTIELFGNYIDGSQFSWDAGSLIQDGEWRSQNQPAPQWITKDSEYDINFSNKKISVENEIWEIDLLLPETHNMRANIIDYFGQVAIATAPLRIVRAPLTWQELIDEAFQLPSLDQKFIELRSLIFEYNRQAKLNQIRAENVPTNVSITEAAAFNLQICDRTKDLLSSDQVQVIFREAGDLEPAFIHLFDMFDTLAHEDQAMDLDLVECLIDALYVVEGFKSHFYFYQLNIQHTEKALHLINDLFAYMNDLSINLQLFVQSDFDRFSAERANNLDALDRMVILARRLHRFKSAMIDDQCRIQDNSLYNKQSHFEFLLLRIPQNTAETRQFFVNKEDYSYLRVPIQEILDEATTTNFDVNDNVDWVCLAVTFYDLNPFLLTPETGNFQYASGSELISVIESVDSAGHRILGKRAHTNIVADFDRRGIQNLKEPFKLSFTYSFPYGATERTFDMRNATCSYFTLNSELATGKWSYEGCTTVFHFDQSTIECLCDNISDAMYQIMSPDYYDPDILAPQFVIEHAEEPIEHVVASKYNSFSPILELDFNQMLSSSDLKYEYSFRPSNAVELSKIRFDQFSGTVNANPDAFLKDYTYVLEMKVTNSTVSRFGRTFTATTTRYYNFTTVAAPYGGQFAVNPFSGYEYYTQFDIEVYGWIDRYYPLNIELTGIYNGDRFGNDFKRVPIDIPNLNERRQTQSPNQQWVHTTELPIIHEVEARITNRLGEFIIVKDAVNITTAPLTWQELIDQAFGLYKVQDRFGDLTGVVREYCRQSLLNYQGFREVPTDVNILEATGYNRQIVDKILTYMNANSINQDGVYEMIRARQSVINLVDLMEEVAHCQESLTLDIVTDMITIMNRFESLDFTYVVYQQDNYNVEKLLHLLDDMLTFLNDESLAVERNDPRFNWENALRNTDIQVYRQLTSQLIKFKTNLADNQCQIRREPVHSNQTHFEMQIMKVPTNSTKDERFFMHSDDLAYMTVPQSELIAETILRSPGASYLCFQTTFFNINPRLLTVETENYQYVDGTRLIGQVETLDSEGYRLLGQNNFGNRAQHGLPKLYTQFNLLFKYNYPTGANANNFDERNVSCSQYTPSTNADRIGEWEYRDCDTEFYFRDRGIMCLCNSIGDGYYQLTEPSYVNPELEAPRVEIVKSNGRSNIVVASQRNDFLLNLQNGQWIQDNVDYNVTVSPEQAVNDNFVQFDETLGRLTFNANALNKGQFYSIKVVARNSTFSRFGRLFERTTTKYYNFTTVTPPRGGEFFCGPNAGYEFETEIAIQLRNWQSYHYPLNLQLYGEYQPASIYDFDDRYNEFTVDINKKSIFEGEVWREVKLLQEMSTLKAIITDSVGEFTEVRTDCNITKAPLSWQELIDLAFSQQLVEDKFHELKMVVNEYNLQAIMNNEGSRGVPTDIILDEALAFNLQVARRTSDLLMRPAFSPTFLAMNSVQSVSNIVDFLDTLAHQVQATSLQIMTEITNALHLVKNLGVSYYNYQQQPESVERLLHCSDDIISFLDNNLHKEDLAACKRVFERVVEFKKDIADNQCKIVNREMQNWQSKFELQIYKMPATSSNADREIFFSYSKDLSRMTVPQKELIAETRQRNPGAQWICFQATFYNVNQALILEEDTDFKFVPGHRLVTQIETVDSTGFHLLSDTLWVDRRAGQTVKGVQNLQDQFIQTFKFDFPQNANANNFDMRNVSCSYLVHDPSDMYRENNMLKDVDYWSHDGCETFYYFSSNEIYCRCNSVSDAYYTLMKPSFPDPTVLAPDFTISKISSPYDYVIAGKTSQFHVDLIRGRLSDSNLFFSMRIYPENLVKHSGYSINEDTGVITILPDTLQKGMTYTIEVVVYNTTTDIFGTDFTAESTAYYEFSTVTPPVGGNFIVNPYEGIEYDTSFTIQIDSWESEFYPLTVDLKGEYYSFKTDDPNDRDHLHDIGLATDKIYSRDDVWRLQTKLPAMHLIKLILRDAAGETTQVTRPVNITKTPLTWQQKIDMAFGEPTLVRKYQSLRTVVSNYNTQAVQNMRGERDVPTDVNIAEAVAFNVQVVTRTRGIEIIANPSIKMQSEIGTVQGLDAIILLLDTIGGPDKFDATLNLELAQLIIDCLNDIETYQTPYKIWQDSEYNLSLMLDLTNNLIGIINISVSQLFFGRNLQQSGSVNEQETLLQQYSNLLQKAIDINQIVLDDQCESQDGHFWSKKEAHFELFSLKLQADSTIEDHEFVFTEDGTTRTYVPTLEMIEENLIRNPDATYVCFQVSFYKVFPALIAKESGHFSFTEDNVPFVKIETVDSEGFRLVQSSQVDFAGLQVESPYVLLFNYDLEGKTEADFEERTLKCSIFETDDVVAAAGEWKDSGCTTSLNFEKNLVSCACDHVSDLYIRLMDVPVDAADLCAREPTAKGCPDFCAAHPNEIECVVDICEVDGTARGCPGFCGANSEDPDCQPSHCDLNPLETGCPEYCAANPEDSHCQSPPPRCFIDPNDPICHPAAHATKFVMKPNVERNKMLLIVLSIMFMLLIVAAFTLCVLMSPRFAKDRKTCLNRLPWMSQSPEATADVSAIQ